MTESTKTRKAGPVTEEVRAYRRMAQAKARVRDLETRLGVARAELSTAKAAWQKLAGEEPATA